MNPAKIRLSPAEMELVTEPGWILTKNGIMQKARWLLEEVWRSQEETIRLHRHRLPPVVTDVPGKISRGENYQGLPYLVLDHPRYFEKENVFAIRTLFWWGQFFSVTLQVSGHFQSSCATQWIQSYDAIAAAGFSAGVHESPWEHHFEIDNYRLVKEMSVGEWRTLVEEKPFLKLAKKTGLDKWETAPAELAAHFTQLLEWTQH